PVPVGDSLTAFEADPPDARVFVYPSRRSLAGGFDLGMFGAGGADELLARLEAAGAVVVGPEQLAAARIAALLPSAGAEGGEGVLPQESGLTSLLSYRKGCYLGQEIMARIEARGKLRRSLASIELDG